MSCDITDVARWLRAKCMFHFYLQCESMENLACDTFVLLNVGLCLNIQ